MWLIALLACVDKTSAISSSSALTCADGNSAAPYPVGRWSDSKDGCRIPLRIWLRRRQQRSKTRTWFGDIHSALDVHGLTIPNL